MDAQLLFGAPPKSPPWSGISIPFLCNLWVCSFVFVSIPLAPALPLRQSSSSIVNGRIRVVQPIVKMMPPALHTYTFTGNRGLYLATKAQPGNGDGDDTRIEQAKPNEETDPSRWNRETSPFVALRRFADKRFTDEELRDVLRKNRITTMEEANDKYRFIVPYLKNQGTDWLFSDAVRAAVKTKRKMAEEILGGIIEYSSEIVKTTFVDKFAEAAVAVDPRDTSDRNGLYSLVMGPSGSGKTLFALKLLASMVFRDAPKNGKEFYTVHVEAENLIPPNATADDLKKNLKDYVEGKIDLRIFDALSALNLYLLVVIDEAGSFAGEYFDTEIKIRELRDFLQARLRYKFTKGMHLALAGTGLEFPTRAMSSKRKTIKFRMQPWSLKNFAAMVDVSKHSNKNAIKTCVSAFPIFQYLASNARCAYYLMDSLAAGLDPTTTKRILPFQSFVDGIISNVAYEYIGSNGLVDLKGGMDKIRVARAVFREITKANKRPKQVFFPDFDDLDIANRRMANSLLDVHVESVNSKLGLMDKEKNSVSMTPALTVVVARLLDENGNISWGWRGMEAIVALGELKLVIQNMSDDGQLGGILCSEVAIPGFRATKNFLLPEVGNSLVVLNGDNAPYADVIAPFRLVQAKFSADREKSCRIDLYEEVSKMGLTTADNKYRLNQAVTSVFHDLWKKEQKRVEYSSEMSPRADYSIQWPNLYDPFQTLLCEVKTKYTKIACHFDKTTNLVTIKTHGNELPRQIPALQDFGDQPVTAVFVTNCQSFKVQKNVTITRDDVEWDGKLKGAKAKEVADLVTNIRENVEFQFVFL